MKFNRNSGTYIRMLKIASITGSIECIKVEIQVLYN